VYQPIVALDTMATAAVEALARWTHPQRGSVPPNVFIPIAEETGLIAPLGRLMLARATHQIAAWRSFTETADLVVSVNLSPRQLADPHVADRVSELLAARSLPASALTLEITESALMDDPQLAAETLTRLRNLGVGISVDDFGTGYSSLSYLRRFPVTSVKIDRTFVENLGVTADDDVMVAGIVNLAHTLGLVVVAEGVENESQRQTLSDLGCDYAQGFLFSRPMPPDELTGLTGR
jgi:EAL domain-containing protein (putative c-di-GMP-specific phosphodiesterase class I)